jgi:hypothetical protein
MHLSIQRTGIVILGVLAMLLALLPAAPAEAATVSNRAYIAAEIGDAFQQLSGLSDAEVDAILAGVPDPGWSDDDGDFDGDGDTDARDIRVRGYAWVLDAVGVMIGTTATTFSPHGTLQRDQTASVFKRILFGPGTDSFNPLYTDVGAINTHSCNIHLISDMDVDGTYGDDPFIIHGFPPVPSLYKPNPVASGDAGLVSEGQVDLMIERLVAYVQSVGDPFQYRRCDANNEETGIRELPGDADLDGRLLEATEAPSS